MTGNVIVLGVDLTTRDYVTRGRWRILSGKPEQYGPTDESDYGWGASTRSGKKHPA